MELSALIELFTTQSNGSLAEKIMLFTVAFFLVKKEMAKQFDGLKNSIKEVGDKLANMEHAHSSRLLVLENEVKHIKNHITKDCEDGKTI